MSRIVLCLALAAFANGCALSIGTAGGPAAPAAAYLPPSTAQTTPAAEPAPAAPAAPTATPPGRQPSAPVASPPPVVEARQRPARPVTVAEARPRPAKPQPPSEVHPAPVGVHETSKKKSKLRFKDVWVEQEHPKSAPTAQLQPKRLVSRN